MGIATMLNRLVAPGPVEHAVEQVEIPCFLGEEMEDFEPVHVAVFQTGKRFEEDDRSGIAVAVEQGEPAARLLGQGRPQQRDNRSDPGPAGESDIVSFRLRIERAGEAAVRRHDVKLVAGFEIVADPVGKHASGDALHRHHQIILERRGAQGIIAPHFLAVDIGEQCQMLAGLREGFRKSFGTSSGRN